MKLKYEEYVIYTLLIITILVLGYTGLNIFDNNIFSLNTKNIKEYQTISGTTNQGDVSIELVPKSLINNNLVLEIKVNTHTIDLNQYDLSKITTLEYNKQKIMPYKVPQLQGHHINGEIIFKIEEKINEFKIIIKGIPKIEERIFKLRL